MALVLHGIVYIMKYEINLTPFRTTYIFKKYCPFSKKDTKKSPVLLHPKLTQQ